MSLAFLPLRISRTSKAETGFHIPVNIASLASNSTREAMPDGNHFILPFFLFLILIVADLVLDSDERKNFLIRSFQMKRFHDLNLALFWTASFLHRKEERGTSVETDCMRKKFSSRALIGISAFLAVALLIASVAGYCIWRHKTLYHFAEVEPGVLYRSGSMSPNGLVLAHSICGFKTIVNLRGHNEIQADEKRWRTNELLFAKKHGVKVVDMPLECEQPPSAEMERRFLNLFDSPENLPVLVHCEFGVIRTGMMIALFEVRRKGRKADDVFMDLPMFGHSLDNKAPAVAGYIKGLDSTAEE